MEGYSAVTDLNHLYNSYKKSKSGSDWKPSVQIYEENWLIYNVKTRQELEEKTYRPKKGKEFTIRERGKVRHIRSNPFYDRVIRRCFCDYVLEPALYPYLIHDNGASVRGKGIGFTRRRFEQKIHEFYRKNHGNDGYILIIDFKKYYDSIPHDKLLEQVEKHLTDPDCIWLIKTILKNFEIDDRPISCGIGDQCSQIFGVYFPTSWDTFFKVVKHIRNFDRYMDDTCIVHKSKEFLRLLLQKAILVANKLGIQINTRKTHIYKLSRSFTFLQIRYRLSKSGHLCKHMNPKRISAFRRRLKKQFGLYLDGKMAFRDVENAFKSWIRSFRKILSKRSLRNLYNLYNELFIKTSPYMEVHMEEKHTIVLGNGKSYEATLNGNNYIFDTVVPSDVFTNDTIKNMKIDGITTSFDKVVAHFMEDGKDHVIFGNFTSTDILRQRVADLESAIALSMGGVS